jgi:hypothetical protein
VLGIGVVSGGAPTAPLPQAFKPEINPIAAIAIKIGVKTWLAFTWAAIVTNPNFVDFILFLANIDCTVGMRYQKLCRRAL